MESKEKSTSFRQFHYCPLCKLSHKCGKKHIYSKCHQQVLQNILYKFSEKIHKVKKDLFSPVVQDVGFEKDAKFWCYFCKQEYLKHEVLESFTVTGAGLLSHITSKDHKANMDQFSWDNLLKKDLKARYILSEEDLHIFKKASFLAVKKKQKSEETVRKKEAERISYLEKKRLVMEFETINSRSVTTTSLEDLPGNSRTRPTGSDVIKHENVYQSAVGWKKTVSASAEGLTVIKQEASGTDEGNVHSGGLPPWLQPDNDTSQSSVIGPTIQDFQKHLEQEKKAKLPANRVGAKFDHTANTTHDWLPSFGRVWSKGRRLQSKHHFEKQMKKESFGNFKHKPASSTVTSSTSNITVTNQNHLYSKSANQKRVCHNTANDNSDWFAPDNSEQLTNQNEGHGNLSNGMPNFERPATCNPYQRKRVASNSATHSFSPAISPSWPNHELNTPFVPYKRHKGHTETGSNNQMKLIQTPVLAENEWDKR